MGEHTAFWSQDPQTPVHADLGQGVQTIAPGKGGGHLHLEHSCLPPRNETRPLHAWLPGSCGPLPAGAVVGEADVLQGCQCFTKGSLWVGSPVCTVPSLPDENQQCD